MNTDIDADLSREAQSWDAYWQDTDAVGAYSAAGTDHPAIIGFWTDFFTHVRKRYDKPRIIDLASGNGAVVRHAVNVLGADSADITCVDISASAIASIREQHRGVCGVVGDLRSMPPFSSGFDVITSQFGLEYAGLDAIDEALRVMAPQGQLALLAHHRDSSIHRECAAGLDAVGRMLACRFIPLAMDFFRAGFDAVRGADRSPYDEAAKRLNPAVKVMEEILAQHGEQVAGGSVAHLYSDVSRIHERIARYDPDEVLDWLERMHDRLEEYVSRMASMVGAAVDDDDFAELCARIEKKGCAVDQAGPLLAPGHDLPLAWALLVSARAS